MVQLEITTEFDNLAFVPADTIRGQVTWMSEDADSPEQAELRLFYYTAGKGTRDVEVIDSRPVPQPGSNGQFDYEFQLPEGPYSFSGKLISVIWALEFQFGRDATERLEFTLSPTGEAVDLYAHDDGNLPEYSGFTLGKSK